MKENLKLAFILCVITSISAFLLAFVYGITKEPIAAKQLEDQNKAMQNVLKDASNFIKSDKEITNSECIQEMYEGKDGDEIKGYVFISQIKGYGGDLKMMIGISSEGKLSGMEILDMSETPGLGANASNAKFTDQFKDKSIEAPLKVVKNSPSTDDEVQAITGATITTKAVTDAMNDAIKYYNENLKEG